MAEFGRTDILAAAAGIEILIYHDESKNIC